jgi:Asp-tRNA(Asn)/Glu-tRNA(Gln) amidotransferase B subunit
MFEVTRILSSEVICRRQLAAGKIVNKRDDNKAWLVYNRNRVKLSTICTDCVIRWPNFETGHLANFLISLAR